MATGTTLEPGSHVPRLGPRTVVSARTPARSISAVLYTSLALLLLSGITLTTWFPGGASGLHPMANSGGGSGGSGPSITAFVAVPASVDVGSSVHLRANVSGLGPFAFAYGGLPPGCTSRNASNLTCSPTSVGTYNVTVNVTDRTGARSSAKLTLYVVSHSTPDTFLGLPGWDGYLLVGIIAAGVVAGTVVVWRLKSKPRAPAPATSPR